MNSKDETEAARDKEIETRLKLYREGRMKVVPLEQMKRDIAARLRECSRQTGSNECRNPGPA
jgi:hypothetical protein